MDAIVPEGNAKVQVRDLVVSYVNPKTGTKTLAVDSLSLDVRESEFVCIVGPSGCGKSTLLKCLDGLLPFERGRILLDGAEVSGSGVNRAVVFQTPSLLPWRTVLRNATYGLELSGVPLREAVERARSVLKLVGLAGFEDYYPSQLSGGMQQRVNLARALAVHPQLILLDEPFSALDAQTRRFMQGELLRIWEAHQKTVIFITHDIAEAIYLADRVIVLTRRPARIKKVIDVPFPRPRKDEIHMSYEFRHLEHDIWLSIEEDISDREGSIRA